MVMLTGDDLNSLGINIRGEGIRISDKASLYGPERIFVGANTRIDDFCVISAGLGGITLGSFVHIAVGCALIGEGEIILEDFSGLSGRVSVYSSSDDYSGLSLTNPTVPGKFRKVDSRPVRIGRHVIVGAGAVILPGVNIGAGAAVGALSLVTRDVPPGVIVAGSPARPISKRSANVFVLEKQLQDDGFV